MDKRGGVRLPSLEAQLLIILKLLIVPPKQQSSTGFNKVAATVVGVEACRRGYRTLFITAAELVNRLVEAREEKQLQRLLNRLGRFCLLIVDELGYILFSEEGSQLLFQVLANRHERASTLVTSNLAFAEWTKVFADASLTAQLLDRLTHRCLILQFDWESI